MVGYLKFIKNTWSNVTGKVCDFEERTVKKSNKDCLLTRSKRYCKWNDEHPAVILFQTSHDVYTDLRASYNYYTTLKKYNVDTEIVTGLCGNHNLFSNALLRVLMFVAKHMGKFILSQL